MSCLICIEESRARQNFTETVAERALTCRNSTGDSDCRHTKLSAVEAALSAAKFQKTKSREAAQCLAAHGRVLLLGLSALLVDNHVRSQSAHFELRTHLLNLRRLLLESRTQGVDFLRLLCGGRFQLLHFAMFFEELI
jgi:hypothetical protein